ncbi:hypothetical protein VdG1_04357 [Verticillium dahliae VDG1]|nr:hypothetical protein VdG1_04357 [Verticillium dahliae VDG1]
MTEKSNPAAPASPARSNSNSGSHEADEKGNIHAQPPFDKNVLASGPGGVVPPKSLDEKSYGVARMEAISSVMTRTDRLFIFFGVFLVAYAYGLDGTLRYAYQPYATASFRTHSLLATVNVLRSVIAAAAQPTAAKIADVFGRVELVCLYIPATPFIINTWVSGDISEPVLLGSLSWRWGIGMWCIIYPFCAVPLIVSLAIVGRRARRMGLLDQYKTSFQILGFKAGMVDLFWRLDVIGIILLIAVFALILVPLTIAGGFESQWSQAKVIAPLVIGVLCIPVFVVWQMRTPHPLVPFRLMRDRGVWGALGIALFLNFAWYMQGNYLYTVLIVAFDMSITAATRITSLYSFVSVITGFILGFIVFKVRRLKASGVIGAQVLLGIAGGMFPYPAQASLQTALDHENLAVMTGLYLATYNIGSAFGNTVSGSFWTQLLPSELNKRLAQFGNETLAQTIYADPFTVLAEYPVGTPVRTEIIASYQHIQRLLCITGICLCVPLIAFAACLRNPHLTDEQTLAEDKTVVRRDEDAVIR